MIMGGTGILCGILLNVVDCCCTRYPVLNWTDERVRAARKAAGELLDDEVTSATAAAAPGGSVNPDGLSTDKPVSR